MEKGRALPLQGPPQEGHWGVSQERAPGNRRFSPERTRTFVWQHSQV